MSFDYSKWDAMKDSESEGEEDVVQFTTPAAQMELAARPQPQPAPAPTTAEEAMRRGYGGIFRSAGSADSASSSRPRTLADVDKDLAKERASLEAAASSAAASSALSHARSALGGMSAAEMADRDIDLDELAEAMQVLRRRQCEDRIATLEEERARLLSGNETQTPQQHQRGPTFAAMSVTTGPTAPAAAATPAPRGQPLASVLAALAVNGSVEATDTPSPASADPDSDPVLPTKASHCAGAGAGASAGAPRATVGEPGPRRCYVWSQDRHTATISVLVPAGTRSGEVAVGVSSGWLTVTLRPKHTTGAATAAAAGAGAVACPVWFQGRLAYPFTVDGSAEADAAATDAAAAAAAGGSFNPRATAAAAVAAVAPAGAEETLADADCAWELIDLLPAAAAAASGAGGAATGAGGGGVGVSVGAGAVDMSEWARENPLLAAALAVSPSASTSISAAAAVSTSGSVTNAGAGVPRCVQVTLRKRPPPGLVIWWQRAFVGAPVLDAAAITAGLRGRVPGGAVAGALAAAEGAARTGARAQGASTTDEAAAAAGAANAPRVAACGAGFGAASGVGSFASAWEQAHAQFRREAAQRRPVLLDEQGNVVDGQEDDEEDGDGDDGGDEQA